MLNNLNLSKKLAIGFGALILMMLISSLVAIFELRRIDAVGVKLERDLFPAESSCALLQSSLEGSISAMREFVLLGDNSEQSDIHLNLQRKGEESSQRALGSLKRNVGNWAGREEQRFLDHVEVELPKVFAAQKKIIMTAHETENVPALALLKSKGEQIVAKADKDLDELLDDESLNDELAKNYKDLSRTHEMLALADMALHAYVRSGDNVYKQQFEEHASESEVLGQKIQKETRNGNAVVRSKVDSYLATKAEFYQIAEEVLSLRDSDNWNQALHLDKTVVSPVSLTLIKDIHEIEKLIEEQVHESRSEMEAASSALQATLIGATILSLLIGGGIAFLISKNVSGSLRAVMERASMIAEGNLSGDPLDETGNDEFSELAGGFNKMQSSLRDQVGQMKAGIENLNSSAAQILASTHQQAAASREQAAAIQEITSTMEELGRSGSDIAEKARTVTISSESASSDTKDGLQAVLTTSRTMDSIREQVEEVAENIVSLSEKTQAVGQITAAVNDVAEQSKLLALNAAIEAASADGNGSRFSVVATEMKNLADQAKESTSQVRELLGEVQKGINTSVMLTEEAVKRAESGKEHADVGQVTITHLAENTEASMNAFQQIIGGTNQQQIGVNQVSQGMLDIRQAVEQTAQSTAELEDAASGITTLGNELNKMVESYSL